MTNPPEDHVLDLDGPRNEASEDVPGVRIGGKLLDLPRELPVDVLEPLMDVDIDVALLVRQVLDAREAGGGGNEALLGALVDTFVTNPNLPEQSVRAVKEMTLRLFGPEGYAHLSQQRLRVREIGALLRFLGRRYGVGLGEASGSSSSSDAAGTTSNATSSGSTDSTSGASGAAPAIPAS